MLVPKLSECSCESDDFFETVLKTNKNRVIDRSLLTRKQHQRLLCIPNPTPQPPPIPKSKKKHCKMPRFCPERIDQISIPKPVYVLDVLQKYNHVLDADRIVRLVKIVHAERNDKPRCPTMKSKRKHRKKKKKKKPTVEECIKIWLKQRVLLTTKLLMKHIKSNDEKLTPNYKQLLIALGLMKTLRLKKKKTMRYTRQYLMQICEQLAIELDNECKPYTFDIEQLEPEKSEEEEGSEIEKKHIFWVMSNPPSDEEPYESEEEEEEEGKQEEGEEEGEEYGEGKGEEGEEEEGIADIGEDDLKKIKDLLGEEDEIKDLEDLLNEIEEEDDQLVGPGRSPVEPIVEEPELMDQGGEDDGFGGGLLQDLMGPDETEMVDEGPTEEGGVVEPGPPLTEDIFDIEGGEKAEEPEVGEVVEEEEVIEGSEKEEEQKVEEEEKKEEEIHPEGTISYLAWKVYLNWLDEYGNNINTYSNCLSNFKNIIESKSVDFGEQVETILSNWSTYIHDSFELEKAIADEFKGKPVSKCPKCGDYTLHNLPADHDIPDELLRAAESTARWKQLLAEAERLCASFAAHREAADAYGDAESTTSHETIEIIETAASRTPSETSVYSLVVLGCPRDAPTGDFFEDPPPPPATTTATRAKKSAVKLPAAGGSVTRTPSKGQARGAEPKRAGRSPSTLRSPSRDLGPKGAPRNAGRSSATKMPSSMRVGGTGPSKSVVINVEPMPEEGKK